jgi:GT2 family glycosyltransferase
MLPASVVVATYNRAEPLAQLLASLAAQTVDRTDFEVVVVDDGSREDATPVALRFSQELQIRVHRQANAGVAVARQRGVERARGRIVVFLDDDMLVKPDFLAQHIAEHDGRDDRVVMGRLLPAPELPQMPLFERFYAHQLDAFSARTVARGTFAGFEVYTGNLSMPRELFLRAGGFDPAFHIEDVELGVRLEAAGADFYFSAAATSIHASDHTSLGEWLARSELDGRSWVQLARKHPRVVEANPWRHLSSANVLARPLFAAAVALPEVAQHLARVVFGGAEAADRLGLEDLALRATTVAYGMQYFVGVRHETGGLGAVARDLLTYHRARSSVLAD